MAEQLFGVDLNFDGNALLNKGIESISSTAVLSPAAISGTIIDYAPVGIQGASILRLNVTGSATLTGLEKPPIGNKMLLMYNVSAGTLTINNESGSSAAANRFSIGTAMVLSPNTSALFYYDAIQSRWVCVGRASNAAGNVTVTGQVYFNGIISATINANTDNWNPVGLSTCNTIRVNCNGNFNLNGIVAQPEGTVIILTNTNIVNTMTIVNNALTSAGANRFLMNANVVLAPNQSCMIQYDALNQRWRVISHL